MWTVGLPVEAKLRFKFLRRSGDEVLYLKRFAGRVPLKMATPRNKSCEIPPVDEFGSSKITLCIKGGKLYRCVCVHLFN